MFTRITTEVKGLIPKGLVFEVWTDSTYTKVSKYITPYTITYIIKLDHNNEIVSFRCSDRNFPTKRLTQKSKEFIISNL